MIRPALPMADYLAFRAVSASDIIAMDTQCPLVAWTYSAFNPKRPSRRDTDATELGTAAHMAILEPDKFRAAYVVKPKGMKLNTKAGIAWRAENPGGEVLSHDEAEAIAGMRDAVLREPLAAAALKVGEAETTIIWDDAETGLECKCRPDWLARHGCFDLKTTIDANPAAFAKQAANLRYYIRAAWGIEALQAIGMEAPVYGFIAVEKSPPYPVIVAAYDQETIEWARIQIRAAMRRFADCLASGKWPGYSDGRVVELTLPPWATRELQQRHERGDFTSPPRMEIDPDILGAG